MSWSLPLLLTIMLSGISPGALPMRPLPALLFKMPGKNSGLKDLPLSIQIATMGTASGTYFWITMMCYIPAFVIGIG
jgi:hypothetical protein